MQKLLPPESGVAMSPTGGGDAVGESGGPSKRRRVEQSAAGGGKEGQSLGVESGSGKTKDPIMSKGWIECLEVRCDDSQRIIKEIVDLKSELDEDLRQLGYCEENDKLRTELAMKVKEMHCLMNQIKELEAKNDLLRKQTEELEAINDGLLKLNEELQAKNDDLTKQNKELQARNDCLPKGNEESQVKNVNLHKNMADEGDCSSEGEKSKSSDELGLESSNNDESHSSGTADDNNNDEDGSDSGESTETESLTFHTQFSMSKLTKLICGLTKPQKDLIRQCGFGSILDLKCSTMPHKQLIVWLANYYDEETQCIKIPGTRAFKLDALIVHWILGIPHGGDKIKSKASLDVKYLIANDTTRGPLAPKIEDLIAMITPELVGDRFVRIFMLVVLSIFLCPTSSPRASCLYYEGIRSVKRIKSYDWCDAVMSSLTSGLSKFQKNAGKGNISGRATLSGCIFVLFTAYFDHLSTKMNIVPQTIPRIGAWTDEFVHQYMQLDPKFKKMKIKTVSCTVFAKAYLNQSRRGSCFDALNVSPSSAANVTGPSQHKPSKEVKTSTKGPSRTLLHENVQIDRDSVQRVIPECTDSGFCIFSGEELHPEVDKYIRYVAGTECSNEQVVGADSVQAKDAELATQKEEIKIKSLKAYLGEGSYSNEEDFCQQKIEGGEKLEKDLRATKAILKAISAEKETAEESLKVVQAELEANKSGLAQALSDRDSAHQSTRKMKEDITELMNEAGTISASLVLAVFKDHYPYLDMSVINKGFKRDAVKAQELIESFKDLAQPAVKQLEFSYDEESLAA